MADAEVLSHKELGASGMLTVIDGLRLVCAALSIKKEWQCGSFSYDSVGDDVNAPLSNTSFHTRHVCIHISSPC
jgi:hypothetical protein